MGFLVWGNPAFYDSTVRVLDAVAERLPMAVTVVPGISAFQALAAAHGVLQARLARELPDGVDDDPGREAVPAVRVGWRAQAAGLVRPRPDRWPAWTRQCLRFSGRRRRRPRPGMRDRTDRPRRRADRPAQVAGAAQPLFSAGRNSLSPGIVSTIRYRSAGDLESAGRFTSAR